MNETQTPNPGSRAALSAGCLCAVLDNNHGHYPPRPPNDWWVTRWCPVHDPQGQIGDD